MPAGEPKDVDFKLPVVAEGVDSVDIAEVLVKVGDTIDANAVICEAETDKSVAEIECPHAGEIKAVHISAGQTVKGGEPLVTISTTTAGGGQGSPAAKPAAAAQSSGRATTSTATATPRTAAAPQTTATTTASSNGRPPAPAGPATRRMARKLGVDLHQVQGSANGGRITIEDIEQAADMGYRIKLLGVAQMTGRGLEQRMQPCLVPETSPLGQLDGGTNMVVLEGDEVGQIVLGGPGAGSGPTASAVLSDICDIARGLRLPTFGQPAHQLSKSTPARSVLPAPYYLRMALLDKPGALAKVATILGDAGVSIDRMRQYGHSDQTAPVLIVTHKTTRTALDQALEAMADLDVLASTPVVLRIESI